MSFLDHRDYSYAPIGSYVAQWHVLVCEYCHFSTTVMIHMDQFEDRWHNSMHLYVNIVSKSVYHGSDVLYFTDARVDVTIAGISTWILCQSLYIMAQMSLFLGVYQTLLHRLGYECSSGIEEQDSSDNININVVWGRIHESSIQLRQRWSWGFGFEIWGYSGNSRHLRPWLVRVQAIERR